MTVYYVDSVNGSDKNSGTGENAAFASLSKVEGLKLKAGDTVLLANGSVFKEQFDIKWSGKEGAPITISNYGNGPAPVITGAGDGIHGSKASNIVIENITIKNTSGNAIYAGNASNWVVNNVTISDTGSAHKSGSLTFQSSKNIIIENSTISNTHSDGIWMQKVTGVQLLNNTILNAQGHNADAVQINDGTNIVIIGNILDQSNSNSAKGVLVLINAANALVEGNTLTGGGFGISAQGGKGIAIHDNDISHYGGYAWSYAIGLGDQGHAKNYDISGNYIHDGVNGVLVSAVGSPNWTREGINVHNNVFDELSKAALYIDRMVNGTFQNNIVADGTIATMIASKLGALKGFLVSGTQSLAQYEALVNATHGVADVAMHNPVTPAGGAADAGKIGIFAHQDAMSINADKVYSGNVLDNDFTSHGNLQLKRFADKTVDGDGITVNGKYGTLHIEKDGDYSYDVNFSKIAGKHGNLTESFQYKVGDGLGHYDADTLVVKIDADAVIKDHVLL